MQLTGFDMLSLLLKIICYGALLAYVGGLFMRFIELFSKPGKTVRSPGFNVYHRHSNRKPQRSEPSANTRLSTLASYVEV